MSAGGWESIERTGAEYLRGMPRRAWRQHYRQARRGNLGSLACSMHSVSYQWLLREVYDLRFPHLGDNRHALNGARFDSLQGGFKLRRWLRIAGARKCYGFVPLGEGRGNVEAPAVSAALDR